MSESNRFFPSPVDYDCPFCKVVRGEGDAITHPSDIVYQDDHTTAFISPKWWPNNRGYAIIIPNQHVQDIFDLSPEAAGYIHQTAQKLAQAYVALYACDGVSTRQHNGAYPLQEVFHYHFHVFPRFHNDQLYSRNQEFFLPTPDERLPYAIKLKTYLHDLT